MGNDAPKFNREVLKANLKMAVSRFGILKNKRLNGNHAYREEIAKLLRQGNEELARIKVESVINNENYMAAVDILSLMCQVCSERLRVIIESKEPPADIRYAVETLVWSASRSDCAEMLKIREQFFALYGEVFCRNAVSNANGLVNSVVIAKLEATVPEEELKIIKLKEIAAEKMIEYVPAGEAWKGMIPDFPSSDIYSRPPSSAPSAPDMSMPPYDSDKRDSPKGSSGMGSSGLGGGDFYPRLSTMSPGQVYNPQELPPPVFNPTSGGNTVSTQTHEEANYYAPPPPLPKSQPPQVSPGYKVIAETKATPSPQSDYDELMKRFTNLKK
mmetsp:Transcript_20852/g.38701  ORF Transcript_20852/g.38701 Transcript_20852/m.38701 type:complete len:329 (-) Transcript_20852:243-1229(-)